MLVKRENCLSSAFFVDGQPPRCAEPARAKWRAATVRRACAGKCLGSCSIFLVSIAGCFPTTPLNDNRVRFAAKPSVWRDALVPPHNVSAWFRLYLGGFLGAEPARASVWGNGCTIVSFSNVGDFSTSPLNDIVSDSWRSRRYGGTPSSRRITCTVVSVSTTGISRLRSK